MKGEDDDGSSFCGSGELVFGEVSTSSLKSSTVRNIMTQSGEESTHSISQARRDYSSSTRFQASQSEVSTTNAPSHGSFTAAEMIDGKGGEVTKVMSTPVVVYHYPSKTKRKTKMPFKLTRGLSVFHSFLFCLDSRSSFKRLDRHEHSLKQGFISRSFLSFLLGFFFAISLGFFGLFLLMV
ncbi:hypothetical protein Dimus_036614 [Dionaea muscipula]